MSYFPVTVPATMSAVDGASARIMAEGMDDERRPVFLSTLTVTADALGRRHPGITKDLDRARILRSVLMKPEEETYIDGLHTRVEALATALAKAS